MNNATNKNKPLFSIIVTIYNKEKYLEECLESILKQKFKNYEILLIDDGSTDGSSDICKQYQENNENIVYFRNVNHGLVWSREFGLKHSNGEFILYVDADDLLAPNHLEICSQTINKHKNVEMIIYGKFELKNDELIYKYYIPNETITINSKRDKEKWFNDFFFTGPNHINLSTGTCLIKKSLIFKHYCRDYRITRGEDWAFAYECLYYSKNTVMLPSYLYYHRFLANSMDHTNELNFKNIYLLWDYFSKHLTNKKLNKRYNDYFIYCLWGYIKYIEQLTIKDLRKISKDAKLNPDINYKTIKQNLNNFKKLCLTDKMLINLLSAKKYLLLLLLFRRKYGK